jgi:hypothetical protein
MRSSKPKRAMDQLHCPTVGDTLFGVNLIFVWPPDRVKEKLRSGEMPVRGDQWPLFLYANLAYDPDERADEESNLNHCSSILF